MSTLPMHSNTSPMSSTFGNIWQVANDYAKSALEIMAAKSLLDINDGDFGLVINPNDPNGRFGIKSTTTTGSAAPKSIWQSYDMLFLGVGAVAVFAALVLKK